MNEKELLQRMYAEIADRGFSPEFGLPGKPCCFLGAAGTIRVQEIHTNSFEEHENWGRLQDRVEARLRPLIDPSISAGHFSSLYLRDKGWTTERALAVLATAIAQVETTNEVMPRPDVRVSQSLDAHGPGCVQDSNAPATRADAEAEV
jgi:hypothetical protein